MKYEALHQVAGVIQEGNDFLLTTHIRPDGDACGALLGLFRVLTHMGKRVAASTQDPIPEAFVFLPGAELVQPAVPAERAPEFGVGIALDCDGLNRAGSLAPVFQRLPLVVDLDHHVGWKAFGDVRAVYEAASSTGELVYHLTGLLGVHLDVETASCLLCAIMYDTGSFRQSNATADALDTAARLIEAGASAEWIARKLYASRSPQKLALKGIALSRIRLALDGRMAYAWLEAEDFAMTGATLPQADGIVEELRDVRAVEVAVLFCSEDSGETKVSLRAAGDVDVADLAARFGGGGHKKAAGCLLDGPPQAVMAAFLAAVESAMGEEK